MDKTRTQMPLENSKLNLSTTSSEENEEEGDDDDFDADYLDDEPVRKPKGKKIRKMRSSYDR